MANVPKTPYASQSLLLYWVAGTATAPTGSSPTQILGAMEDAGGADMAMTDTFNFWRGQEVLRSEGVHVARDEILTLRGMTFNQKLLDAIGAASSVGVMMTAGSETSDNRKIVQSTLSTRGRFLLSLTQSDDGMGAQLYIPRGLITSGLSTIFSLGEFGKTDITIEALYDSTALYSTKWLEATVLA